MWGKLVSPEYLHLSKSGRKDFTSYLRKQFGPKSGPDSVHRGQPTSVAEHNPVSNVEVRPGVRGGASPGQEEAISRDSRGQRDAGDTGASRSQYKQQPPPSFSRFAREIAVAISEVLSAPAPPAWRRDSGQPPDRPNLPSWLWDYQ